MSSRTDGQQVVFECDECSEEYVASGEWRDVWESAKEEGWRAFKDDNDEWHHRCPECRS